MNWFASYYQNALAGNTWLSGLNPDNAVFTLLFSLFLGFTLLVIREIKVTTFLASAGAAWLTATYINPVFSFSFLHTGSRLDTLSLDTVIISIGMIFGPAMLLGTLIKRFRSLDRMMIGLLLTTVCWLIFGYHLALINGGLKQDLKIREESLVSILKLSGPSFNETCKALQLDCREGKRTEKLQHVSSEIEHQANDFLTFYRKSGKSPILFSDSNALIAQSTPYAYAYIETPTKFRWVIETKQPEKIFASYKAMFSLFCSAAVYFWTFFIFSALFLHNLMRFFRLEAALKPKF